MARFYDGNWGLFDYDFETGRSVWRLVQEDGSEVFRIDYPVENIVKANAEHFADGMGQRWGDGQRVASIPLNVFHDETLGLDQAHLDGDEAYLRRWLNDSDNRDFRAFPGNL